MKKVARLLLLLLCVALMAGCGMQETTPTAPPTEAAPSETAVPVTEPPAPETIPATEAPTQPSIVKQNKIEFSLSPLNH